MNIKSSHRNKLYILLVILCVSIVVFVIATKALIPPGYDYRTYFRPASQALWAGKSPYVVSGFFNPPWLAILLLPFTWLPDGVAWGLFFTINIALYFIALKRMGIKLTGIVVILSSPYVFFALWHGNVDSLVLLGTTLSPAWGIWLLLIKPQLTIGLILVWFYQSYQKGWKTLLCNFGPACAVYLGCWILGIHPTNTPIHEPWNIQAWPWGIIPGLVLVWLAIKNKNNKLAIAASPFVSPYVGLQTWVGTLLPASEKTYLLIFGTVLGWMFVLSRWLLNIKALKYEPALLVGWGVIIILANFRETAILRK